MLTIDVLKEFGANTEEGLGRCLNKEAFYLKLVGRFLDNPGLDKLEAALQAGDMSAAFDAAHGIKGVLTNLALTPIAEPVSEMTELLRAKTEMDYTALMTTAKEQLEKLQGMAAD